MKGDNNSSGSPTSASAKLAPRSLLENPSTSPNMSMSASGGYSGSHGLYKIVFDYFDRNRDGKISPEELQSCLRSAEGQFSVEEVEAAISTLDLDGDGMLGFEEFKNLVESSGDEEDKRKELKDAFNMYEMAGSGCITPASLKKTLSNLGESRSIDDCKTMIRAFDLNGDGVLSFDEFSNMMR